jgi:iron complex outermembrane receptor protein
MNPPKPAHGVAAALVCLPALVYAQGVAQDKQLETVVITGRAPTTAPLATTVESRSAEALRELNFINTEDALRTLPNLTIRKRYIGDRNALIGGRSHSTLQAARGMLFADGYLLSQFLGNFNAPRWNMIAPEEIERIDVLYGPFSAIYPGNSIGTTIVATTRRPQAFEASARVQAFTQHYDGDGYDANYAGRQASMWFGNRAGAGWYSLGANTLVNRSQPMQYATVLRSQGTAPSANAVAVTGATPWRDPQGRDGYLLGPNGSAIEDNRQNQVKLRFGYDFSEALSADALAAVWNNVGNRFGASTLRDAAGNTVWSGPVVIDGAGFTVPAGAFAPQRVEERHDFLGLTLKANRLSGWNASVVFTHYDIALDETRTATGTPPQAATGGAGTLTDAGGTGWNTLDLQATFDPAAGSALAAHRLAFGYHINRYELQSRTFNTGNWQSGAPTAPVSGFFGRTSLQALFAQDQWNFAPDWTLTAGVRFEDWQASDGARTLGAAAPVIYPDSSIEAWSPKLALARQRGPWTYRLTYGRGVRFPTVSELFQGSVVGNTIVNNDPFLKPERSDSKELSAVHRLRDGEYRVSLFEDDVRDTIWSQLSIFGSGTVATIQNIDRVRTRGIEFSGEFDDVLVRGLRLGGSVAFNDAAIVQNRKFPASEGKRWLRVPRVRGALTATYAAPAAVTLAAALRYSGRQYNTLDNSDVNPDTFGGVSTVQQLDLKASWRPARRVELALGVDNATDQRAYQFHPFPARTWVAELRFSQ